MRQPLVTMTNTATALSQWVTRSQINIEQRKGFIGGGDPFNKPYTDPDGDPLPDVDDPLVYDSLRANSKVYLGSPWKLYSRYRFRYRQNISVGVTMEKDEGEEFFRGSQPQGFDYYSAHLFLRNIGPVKAVAVSMTTPGGKSSVRWRIYSLSGLRFRAEKVQLKTWPGTKSAALQVTAEPARLSAYPLSWAVVSNTSAL